MGKRGKKCLVSHEERIEELKRHEICTADGKLKKENDPVWQVICDNIEERDCKKIINVRNLYRYITINLKTILAEINIVNAIEDIAEVTISASNVAVDERDEESILLKIQKNVFYKPAIRELCISPLTVWHWTIEATDFSKDLAKNRVYIFSLIGSFCKPFTAPDGLVGQTINFYALGTEISNTFVPLCQMSTEDCSLSLFGRFFSECIRSGLAIPNLLVLDYYSNHYLTANEAFNAYLPYEDYLVMCYDYLSQKAVTLPRVIINTHIRFLVIKIKRWNSICEVQLPSVKKFHLYSIIVLSLQ